MPDNDQNLNRVVGPHHVEGLASVSDRVLRKKDQQQRDQHKRKPGRQIEKQLEEQLNEIAENTDDIEDGHIDFRA